MAGNISKVSATERLVKLGIQPRLLDLELAAAYVGLSPATFLTAVKERSYPAAISDGRRKMWDRRALDAAVDRRSGLASTFRRDESHDAIMRAIDAAE